MHPTHSRVDRKAGRWFESSRGNYLPLFRRGGEGSTNGGVCWSFSGPGRRSAGGHGCDLGKTRPTVAGRAEAQVQILLSTRTVWSRRSLIEIRAATWVSSWHPNSWARVPRLGGGHPGGPVCSRRLGHILHVRIVPRVRACSSTVRTPRYRRRLRGSPRPSSGPPSSRSGRTGGRLQVGGGHVQHGGCPAPCQDDSPDGSPKQLGYRGRESGGSGHHVYLRQARGPDTKSGRRGFKSPHVGRRLFRWRLQVRGAARKRVGRS